MGQDGQGLGLVVLVGLFFQPNLGLGITAQKQYCDFAERPFQIGITDFATAGTTGFSRGLAFALDQACIGGKILYPGKAGDIVDFRNQRPSTKRTYTRPR